MWKIVSWLTGGALAALASLCTLSASFARIEEAGDYEHLMVYNVLVGGMFALAIVLFCAPCLRGASRARFALVMASAVLIWVTVSGRLIWLLDEQVRVRSMQ